MPARPEDVAQARRREEEARAEAARKQAAAEKSVPPPRSASSVLLIVLLCILALPLLVPLAAVVCGLLVGLAALVFGLGVGVGALVLAVLVVGAVVFVSGLSMLALHTLEALLACGVGLTLLGAGIIMLLVCVWLLIKVLPALFRFLLRILRWPFERRVARA
jgi:uncharacterized membrane protein